MPAVTRRARAQGEQSIIGRVVISFGTCKLFQLSNKNKHNIYKTWSYKYKGKYKWTAFFLNEACPIFIQQEPKYKFQKKGRRKLPDRSLIPASKELSRPDNLPRSPRLPVGNSILLILQTIPTCPQNIFHILPLFLFFRSSFYWFGLHQQSFGFSSCASFGSGNISLVCWGPVLPSSSVHTPPASWPPPQSSLVKLLLV
jgi:hypothetical protein